MSDDTQAVQDFIAFFGGEAKTVLESNDARVNAKQLALSGLIARLDKKTIRAGFVNLKIKDSSGKEAPAFSDHGQEYEIDTFDSIKGGEGIKESDQAPTQKAMDLYVAYKNEALSLKYPEGDMIFDVTKRPQEFIDDCITPLVRERILPDNFIVDALSDTFQLINNALKSNSAEQKKLKAEKLEKYAKIQTNFMGGRGKLDRATAIGGKVEQLKGRMINAVGKKNVLAAKNLVQGAGALKDVGAAGFDLKGWIPKDGKIPKIETAKLFLDPGSVLKMTTEDGEKKYGVEGWKHIKDTLKLTGDGDDQRVVIEEAKQMKQANFIKKALMKVPGFEDKDGNKGLASQIGELIAKPSNPILRDAKFYTSEGVNFLLDNITNGIDIGGEAGEIHKLRAALESANHDEKSRRIAVETIDLVDNAFSDAIKKINSDAGDAISDLYSKHVDSNDVEEATAPNTDGVKLVDLFAAGFSRSLSSASPELIDVGSKIADHFNKSLNGKSLSKNIQSDPKAAFASFVKAATDATNSVADLLSQKLSDKRIIGDIALSDIFPGEDSEEEAKQVLEESDKEIAQFEKDLVLIDEGGLSVAQQRSIEVLIAKLEKDRQVLMLVKTIGGSLQSLASGPMSIVGYAVDGVSDVVVGEVLGPLKAAKLIMKLATDIKQATERHALYKKFHADLQNSRVAVSSLSSTIQGFFNNKAEQNSFRDLEIALTIVQIAGEVIGSVPTPITLAIGKSMSKVAAASQSVANFAESQYNQKMLQTAWKKTLEAIQNPGNRKVGLQALRLNPTLGMHAIAWAGIAKQPPDPVARMFMASCGLDENTLAVSGTEDKVRTYLQTLLHEDRRLDDVDALEYDVNELNVDWAPPLSLDYKCWALLTVRASRDASPKLVLTNAEKRILHCFKALGKHETADAYAKKTDTNDLDRAIADMEVLRKSLKEYQPQHQQGTHEDMENEVAGLISLLSKRLAEMKKIRGVLIGVVEARKELNDCLIENKLEERVNEALKLPPAELAELFLCQISYNKSVFGKADAVLNKYFTMKSEQGVVDTYSKIEDVLGKLEKRVEQDDVTVLLEKGIETLEKHLSEVTTVDNLRKIASNKEAVESLSMDIPGLNEFCSLWEIFRDALEEGKTADPESIAQELDVKSFSVCKEESARERIVEIALTDILAQLT